MGVSAEHVHPLREAEEEEEGALLRFQRRKKHSQCEPSLLFLVGFFFLIEL